MTIYKVYPEQITCIDTGLYRPALAACYLIEGGDQVAFVDSGTNHSIEPILALLAQRNIPLEAVAYVILTHIHLDHAGGAGKLMQALPRAKLVVHPRGTKHMINPEILQASAMSVYGEDAFHKIYGDLIPVDANRVISAEDGFKLNVSGRELLFLDTPGHAYHHVCIYDARSQGFFTGDTFGLSYRELDSTQGAFMMPTTTPTQFDPEAWYQSLDRLMAYQPRRMYLTHYGMVEQPEKRVEDLRQRLKAYVDTAVKYAATENKSAVIKNALLQTALSELAASACALSVDQCREVIEFDVELNTQGLVYWLDHKR